MNKYIIKISIFISVLFLTSFFTSCNNGASNKDNIYKEITDAFYKQKFVDKNISDDSAFSNYYRPRKIEKESFLMNTYYGKLNEYHVSNFIINGFYSEGYYSINQTSSVDGEILNDEKDFASYGINVDYDELYPIFYKDGIIYFMDEIIDKGLIPYIDIANFFFAREDYSDVINLPTFELESKSFDNPDLINNIYREYFENIPNVVGENKKTRSLLINEFETIKEAFIKKYITDKGYINDEQLNNDISIESWAWFRNITDRSVVFNRYYEYKDMKLIFYDVNGHELHWNTMVGYEIGNFNFSEALNTMPMVYINNEVYLLIEAYEMDLIPNGFWNYLKEEYPFRFTDYTNHIENKRLEYSVFYS